MGQESLTLPALRGRQGDRVVYVVLPTNGRIVGSFTSEVEPHDQRSQRALNPKHAEAISSYLLENRSEYVLGALTYAIDAQGAFEPLSPDAALGHLTLPADATLRSIDGQHRRAGLQTALETASDLAFENTAVLLYVEDDLARRRQMFSDMNWTARRVSASQNIAFDSRDPFSRSTQFLVRSHPFLRDRVEKEAARVLRGSDKLYTLAAVYDAAKRLTLGPTARLRSYANLDEKQITDRAQRFFDVLGRARPELSSATGQTDMASLREKSILVSSTTLRVLAGAVFQCIEHHRRNGTPFTIQDVEPRLAEVDFSPDAALWQESGFVSPGKATPNARNQEVLAATNLLAGVLLGLHRA